MWGRRPRWSVGRPRASLGWVARYAPSAAAPMPSAEAPRTTTFLVLLTKLPLDGDGEPGG